MIFSSKPDAILYFRRDALLLVTKKTHAQLDLTPDIISNLEILDQAKFISVVTRFLASNKMRKQHVLLALDDGIVFQKLLPLTKDMDRAAIIKDFGSKVPFQPELRQVMTVNSRTQLVVFGVNKMLYELVQKALLANDNKLQAVVPAVFYRAGSGPSVAFSTIATFIDNTRPARLANFLETL